MAGVRGRAGWRSGAVALLLGVVWVATPAAPAAQAEDAADKAARAAAEAFERLYGQDVERVRGTTDPADDVALAQRLLAAAREATGTPALLTVLCEKACDLAAHHPQGYATAVEAAEFLASQVPAQAPACAERVVEVRQKAFAVAEGDAKAAAGEALIDSLLAVADAHVEAGTYPQGISALKRAAGIARAVGSGRLPLIDARRERAQFLLRTQRDIANMAALLERDPKNAAARGKLVRLYLVQRDDPAAAATHLEGVEDKSLTKYVPAAGKGVDAAPELACVELGDWYRGLGENAPTPAKRAMFARAKAYYERFLALHASEDLERTTATLGLKKVEGLLAALGPAPEAVAGGGKTAPAMPSEAAALPKDGVIKPGEWVDLLPLVDVTKEGASRHGDAVTIRSEGGGRQFGVPVAPAGDYQFVVDFVRTKGNETVWVNVPVGDRRAHIKVGDKRNTIGGIANVNGKDITDPKNPTRVKPCALKNNTPYRMEVDVAVRGDPVGITVRLNGQPFVQWQGSPSALPISNWQVGFHFGAWNSTVAFRNARLKMLSGEAKVLRPAGEAATSSAPKPAETASAPEGGVFKPGEWVDLLPLVDPTKDAVKGNWARDGSTLAITEKAENGRIVVPVVPAGSYHLQCEFVRTDGTYDVFWCLPVGPSAVGLKCSVGSGLCDGLDLVDGLRLAETPTLAPYKAVPSRIQTGKAYTLDIDVRCEDEKASIRARLNGEPYLYWSGSPAQLSVHPNWALPRQGVFGLGAWHAEVAFRHLRLKMLSGKAKVLRPK